MKNIIVFGITLLFLASCSSSESKESSPVEQESVTPPTDNPIANSDVSLYLTKSDKSALFQLQNAKIPLFTDNGNFSINVDPDISYQEIDGFGFALTGGSALHLNTMSPTERVEILNELFSVDGIGTSYLRISIGASDLDIEPFSYNDLPNGETDENLDGFSIANDQENLIPVLKEILAINPDIKILGSPWSPPSWMKTSNSTIGGSLNPMYYNTYANYFVKYIRAYETEGITIDAISVQNEPQHDTNNPSMLMQASEMADFVKNNLGPTFEIENIQTKIIVWDHNADNPNYPISILNDAEAKPYIDGSAFHLYAGSISSLSSVHNAHPDKNIYFTEQWVSSTGEFGGDLSWHTRELIVGATRNWSKNVIEWNLVSNSQFQPRTPGGCTECLGALTIDGNVVKRNVAYYIIAHASKFVTPGSVRINSNTNSDLPNVAFKTPDDKIVVVVLNNSSATKSFNILTPGESIKTSLDAGSVGTYVW